MNEFVIVGLVVCVAGMVVTLHATGVIDIWAVGGIIATFLGAVLAYLSLDQSNKSPLRASPKVDKNKGDNDDNASIPTDDKDDAIDNEPSDHAIESDDLGDYVRSVHRRSDDGDGQ